MWCYIIKFMESLPDPRYLYLITNLLNEFSSHFQLNASWAEWNELTKWPIFVHLSKFVIKYRLQVSGSDSVELFTQEHLCREHSKSLYYFPFSFACLLARKKLVDQMTFNWSFGWFSYQNQNESVRQWFHGFVDTTSQVLWHSKYCLTLEFWNESATFSQYLCISLQLSSLAAKWLTIPNNASLNSIRSPPILLFTTKQYKDVIHQWCYQVEDVFH